MADQIDLNNDRDEAEHFVAIDAPESVGMVGDGKTSLENFGLADSVASFVRRLLNGKNYAQEADAKDILILSFYKKQVYFVKVDPGKIGFGHM